MSGGFALVVVLVGATYGVVEMSKSGQIDALKIELDSERRKSDRSTRDEELPQPTLDSTDNTQALGELSSRISELEQERNSLLSQLSKLSVKALSPSSELGGLIRQLEDDDVIERQAAAVGLFELDDPRSISALVAYYWNDRREAGYANLATQHMRFIWRHDHDAGMDFMIKILQADNSQHAKWAYEEILEKTWLDDFDKYIPMMEGIALRSEDALVRTRAKLVIQRRAERVEFQKELDAKYGEENKESN